jgi:hypothetical protein
MTDFASKVDRDSLTDLWQSCFGDSEDYIRCFWILCGPKIMVLFFGKTGK